MLRNTIIVIVCSLLLGLIAGCQTLSRDKPQQIRKYSRVSELNRRMLAEDIDKWLLLDKPSKLSQWHIPSDR